MIHFSCKKCGKQFKRPPEAAGALIFCKCGAGNRLPWEDFGNEVLVPEAPATEAPTSPAVPDVVPLVEESTPAKGQPRYQRAVIQRDPAFCFNHQDRPCEHTCTSCGEKFCAACVVTLQDQGLCGPCKNFRLRSLQRLSRISPLAIISLVLGLATGPLGIFCISPVAVRMEAPAFGYAGLLLPGLALLLGMLSLHAIETNPRVGGRSIAITGVVTALVMAFLTILWTVLVQRQME
jgi:hypothetical protein